MINSLTLAFRSRHTVTGTLCCTLCSDFRDGGQEGLALRQKMDENKYNLCKKHGIRILYHCTKAPFLPEIYLDKIYLTIGELIEEINRLKE